MTLIRFVRYVCAVALLVVIGAAFQPAWAVLPTPNQPILVVQDSSSADRYQNFVPELLRTEGLNGFQTAQLTELTGAFLANYDVVILPPLTLTAPQAALFQTYVNNGGTLVGFRPSLLLANVFGVASLGTTRAEGWLSIDSGTPYTSSLDSQAMKFHGTADLYSLSGAIALATLYDNPNSPTASPAAAIYSFGLGKAILFSFDLTQSLVLMRQGNPAWAGYPNNHDGYNTMRPPQMFKDIGTGQFWNEAGGGGLNDVPQADIQLRLFSNALTLSNAAKRPLPRLWYFPDKERAMVLMTGDHHGASAADSNIVINRLQAAGGKYSLFLWDTCCSISPAQVNSWIAAGHSIGIHFNDTLEMDGSGQGASALTWTGMQNVINNAVANFASEYPAAPPPLTTRTHFLAWLSRNAAGVADQTAQAKLYQSAGVELDTSYAAFPNIWGYMTGSGLPMKFLDTVTGAVIPVYQQLTQYEDDNQLSNLPYSVQWNLATAQQRYEQSLSDSLTKYNTVVTFLFHPEWQNIYGPHMQTALDYAQAHSIPMFSTDAWLQFWKGRAATGMSHPAFASNTLTFTATGAPAGLTLLVPHASGNKVVSTLSVDGSPQSFAVEEYQGVLYASVVLTAGTHNISATYTPAGKILGQVSPSAASSSTSILVEGGSISTTVSVAANGNYAAGPLPAGNYTLTPSSSDYTFTPATRSVTLATADVTGNDFTATANPDESGQTLFTTQVPSIPNFTEGPGTNVELGTVFFSVVNGQITALRYWKAPSDVGTHTGRLWSITGDLLASVTFANETASGWQQQNLVSPVVITANTSYVVSVSTANSYYVATGSGLASQVVNEDLRSVVGQNGRFGTPGQFPTGSFLNTNYFRDIVFFPSGMSSLLSSVSLNPTSVIGGTSSTGTVTLTMAAPAGGAFVTLSSNNAAATVPASVTVLQGATTANFPVTTSGVASTTTVTLTASYGLTHTATLNVNPPAILSVSLNPASVAGGSPSTATVTLNSPAPVGGALVTLSSNNAAATVPASVTVGAGSTSVNVPVTTIAVGTSTSANISATYNGTQFGVLNIDAAALISISLSPASVTGGGPSTGTVTLSSPAPAGGAVVALSSDNAAATVPASVTVDGGNITATFPLATTPVSTLTAATITGVYNGSRNAIISINSPSLLTLALNPVTVTGGHPSVGTVTISGPAPAVGAVVMLLSDNAAASVPVSVTVPANMTSADFPITTGAVSFSTLANISATFDSTQAASLAINSPELLSMSLNPANVAGGNASIGTATLTGPAPAGGAVVMLSSDDPINPGLEGVYSPAGLPQDGFVDWANLGPAYSSVPSETITPVAGIAGLNITISTATGLPLQILTNCAAGGDCGWYGNFAPDATILWMNGTYDGDTGWWAPHGPLTVNFSSPQRGFGFQAMADESGPFEATLCAYDLAETLLGCVTSNGNGTTTADGSAAFFGLYDDASQISLVTIDAGGPLYPHDFAIGRFFVASTRRQMVPVSVTVPAGATSATFPVNTNSVSSSISVNIAGTHAVTKSVNLTIDPSVLSTVTLTPASVTGGTALMGTATLDGTAPAGGAVVMLSANNPVSMGVQRVTTVNGLPRDGSVNWTDLGPSFSMIPSETIVPVTGIPDLTLTVVSAAGLPMQIVTNCPAIANCGWYGDFVPAAPLLWPGGTSDAQGVWTGNGPLTLVLSSPQRGLGFNIMADEAGPFSATLCAYGTDESLLGCSDFVGNGSGQADGSAIYVGLYSDNSDISLLTIDGGGALYPHDFAIGQIFVATSRRMVPPSVMVQAGARTATFPVNTDMVGVLTTVTVTGGYQATHEANLIVTPPPLTGLSLSPTTVTGGDPSTGTVTLSTPAPAGGAVVALSSDNAAATVPATVTIDAGATTASFPISTSAVTTIGTTATISASNGGSVETSDLTMMPLGQTLLTTEVPSRLNDTDGPSTNSELGMAFTSVANGWVTAIRFWKASNESGTHIGRIWSSTGTLLGSVTFTGETGSGWQQQFLAAPIAIVANTTYVVSVNTGNSFYVSTSRGFVSQVVNGSLRSVVGNNGRYGPTGQFPTNTWESSNYFRDIVFVPGM